MPTAYVPAVSRKKEGPHAAVDEIVREAAASGASVESLRTAAYVGLLYGAGIGTAEALTVRHGDYCARERTVTIYPSERILAYRSVDWRARAVPILPRVAEILNRFVAAVPKVGETALLLADQLGRIPRKDAMLESAVSILRPAGTLHRITEVHIRDAYVRAIWAADTGHGHAHCLLGLARGPVDLGRAAYALPDLTELAAFLDAAHPWGRGRSA